MSDDVQFDDLFARVQAMSEAATVRPSPEEPDWHLWPADIGGSTIAQLVDFLNQLGTPLFIPLPGGALLRADICRETEGTSDER